MSKLTKHSDDTDKGSEGPPNEHSNLISNGVENAGGDGDDRCRGQWLCYANPGTEMLEQKVSIEALDGESEIVSDSTLSTETDASSKQSSVSKVL